MLIANFTKGNINTTKNFKEVVICSLYILIIFLVL